MPYEMWSPVRAPSAAATITATRFGSPPGAKTAAVITTVSPGIAGKNASTAVTRKITRYTHGEVTVWCSRSNTYSMASCSALATGHGPDRARRPGTRAAGRVSGSCR